MRNYYDLIRTAIIVISLSLPFANRADAAQIRLLAAGALTGAMETLIPQFEASTGHKVEVSFDIIERIGTRIRNGEAFDLAIESPRQWELLAKEGRLDPSVRAKIASVKWGLYVKKGAPKPDISSVTKLKQALLNARSIAYSSVNGPIQAYQTRVTEQIGLTEALKPKAIHSRLPRPGEVGVTFELVMNGSAELGFGTIGEILSRPTLDLVGPMPQELQATIEFLTVLPSYAKEVTAAKALIDFFVSQRALFAFRAAGLDPD